MAGRYGYCGLDRTRATLQGDEVRACWQPPVREETFEGLFRELSVRTTPVAPDEPALTRPPDEPIPGTRTWALPIHGTPDPASAVSASGATFDGGSSTHASNGTSQRLVEAPFVAARGIRPLAASLAVEGRGSLEVEVHRVPGGTAIGRHDPDAHQAIPSGGSGPAQSDP